MTPKIGKKLDLKWPVKVSSESPVGWPIPRESLAGQIEKRLRGLNLPNQQETSYCGPAAFLYCLLQDRPDLYAAYAISLWSGNDFSFKTLRASYEVSAARGTIAALNDIHRASPREGHISDLDWMTMASLSAAAHNHPRTAGTSQGKLSQLKAITWPSMILRWFASVGVLPVFDSVGLGIRGKSMAKDLDGLLQLLAYWGNHWLILQIDPSLIEGGSGGLLSRHWVVVDPYERPVVRLDSGRGQVVDAGELLRRLRSGGGDSPADLTTDALASVKTNLKVVSWGDEPYANRTGLITLGQIMDRFYGGYAFAHFRG